MKKGDMRKHEILRTAEQLFCLKGYDQTSIQNILDQLQTSKGSFYHHFISKEALLETICANRAVQCFERMSADSAGPQNTAAKLNHLLTGMIPFQDEKLNFILMLLPTFVLSEGKNVKTSYCESLRNVFFYDVCDTIDKGKISGEIICGDPAIFADAVISLVNRLWVSVCDMIIKNEREERETDMSELLNLTENYRTAVERVLSLEYGSLVLIDIPAMKDLIDQIHMHWNHK